MRMRRKKNLGLRLERCENLYVLESREFYMQKDKQPEYFDLSGIFGNDNPVELEIGCGKGKFIKELALRNPNVNYIAVEKMSNVIVSAAESAEGIKNLIFLNLSAENLELFLQPASVRKIYLNFSCPYPKNSYANRRLTSPRFLGIYERLLISGGTVRQKTDNKPFFDYSIECFTECGYTLSEVSYDLKDEITTEYEDRFIINNFPIYALTATPPALHKKTQ